MDAQQSNNNIAAVADSVVKDIFKKQPVASISIGIKKNGKILLEKTYGVANVELNVPASIHSVYYLNSISKMFTAISVLQLVEQGKLSLDDEISKWLEGYDSVKAHFTVRQLLSHSSGLKDYEGDVWKNNYKSWSLTALDWIEFAKKASLDFPPGTSYQYSNAGFNILAFIVEKASGEKFPDYIKKNIVQPAGLKETGHYLAQSIIPRQVTLYDVVKGKLYRADEWGNDAYGSGQIRSTIDDLLKFQDALNKNILIKPSSLAEMRAPLTINGKVYTYGFGMRIIKIASHNGYGHTGSGGGSTSVLHYFPADDLTIAVLINAESYDDSKYPSAASIAQIIEEKTFHVSAPVVKDLAIPENEIQKYTGNWSNPDVTIFARNNQLWVSRGTNDSTRLFYQGNHKFVPDNNHSVILDFQFKDAQTDAFNVYLNGNLVAVCMRKTN
jgi:CubicO group peptidase (beta-lactamase class C family)